MMMFLLVSVALGLAGVVGATVFGGFSFATVPDLPAAGSVLGVLITLYLATLLSHRGERRFALWPTLLACASGAVLVAGAYNKNAPLAVADILSKGKAPEEALTLPYSGPASVRVRRSAEGGFFANSEINSAAMVVRIDNGAATVVLKQSDAEKAGIDISNLTFDTPLRTANGTSYLAPVRLKSVRIGPLVMHDVEGLVAKPGTLNENLLGTSFLRRLASYELAGNFATLRQ
jgi:aspartyl protease family protein